MTTPGRSLGGVARSERIYRRLLVVYPRSFRDEYGDDMVQGFRDLMVFSARDRRRGRSPWGRAVRDLVPSAAREWGQWFRSRPPGSPGVLAVVILLAATALVFGGPVFPVFMIPVFVLVVLPAHGLWRFRRAWVQHRAVGGPVARHLVIGVLSLLGPALLVAWLREDAGYWIFISVALTAILSSAAGILWALLTLFVSRGERTSRRRWLRPALVLVPSMAVLGFIIGASYNSYRNSLGPPGDHSVANASADTRALWEAAGEGDLVTVMELTATTCADPWVKFPVGGGRHNAKGWAETRGLQVSGPLDEQLRAIADHLGDYMDVWYDRCGRTD